MTFSETDRELWLRVEVSDDGCLDGGFCPAEKGRDGKQAVSCDGVPNFKTENQCVAGLPDKSKLKKFERETVRVLRSGCRVRFAFAKASPDSSADRTV